ncbi:SDR family NAD(P)-dependent oxidoreductase [Streptomyces bobili]|uniref:SDR family NAD(P)-dependent oxidoreductase n=1 Tax=Streptomyces bobili TaxID=67280 RepID=UPI0037019B3F
MTPPTAPAVPETTLHELLLSLPPGAADRTAMVDAVTGERWTHRELRTRAVEASAAFTADGVTAGEPVVLSVPNGAGFAAGLLGLLAAGAVVSPVGTGTPAPALARQSTAIGAGRLLSAPVDTPNQPRLHRRQSLPNARPAPDPAAFGDAPALLPWSSGTTATPKPIVVSHRNAVAGLVQLAAAQPLHADDVLLGVLPFSHMFGLQYILNHALLSGATIVLLPRWDTEQAMRAIEEHRVTLLHAVPPMIRDLALHSGPGRWDFSSLQQVISGGAPLAPQDAARCEERLGAPVDAAYGLTEVNTCHLTPRGTPRRKDSCGLPVPGTEYRVMTAAPDGAGGTDSAVAAAGTVGELHLRGPQVAQGYLNPDGRIIKMTDEDAWLATGDLVRVDDDGHLYVVDRLKDVIKCNGHQVSPAEVEAVLREHPAVADAAVVPVPDPRAGQLPAACVVLTPGAVLTPELVSELKEFTGRHLPSYSKPRIIKAVASVERTASGKPLRRLLADQFRQPSAPDHPPRPSDPRCVIPDLSGHTVLITGGSRGLGRALAEAFLISGARVAATGRDPERLAALQRELGAHGDLRTATVDSTDQAALRELAASLLAAWGRIDTLITNAGVPGPCGPAWENDPAQWWHAQEVNLRGTFLACHTITPVMIKNGSGRVISIASNAGRHRWPHMSAYSVSKAAAIKFTENLAAELHPHGVRAFSYHPGLLTIGMATTQLTGTHPPGSWDERIQQWYLRQHAAGHTTATEHSTRGALLIAAGVADHLSGHYLTPDHPALNSRPAPAR